MSQAIAPLEKAFSRNGCAIRIDGKYLNPYEQNLWTGCLEAFLCGFFTKISLTHMTLQAKHVEIVMDSGVVWRKKLQLDLTDTGLTNKSLKIISAKLDKLCVLSLKQNPKITKWTPLWESLTTNATLIKLKVGDNINPQEASQALDKNRSICVFKGPQVPKQSYFLKRNAALAGEDVLDLSGEKIPYELRHLLLKYTYQAISLNRCGLCDFDIQFLKKLLKDPESIEFLDLGNNPFESLEFIYELLPKMHRLTFLHLFKNQTNLAASVNPHRCMAFYYLRNLQELELSGRWLNSSEIQLILNNLPKSIMSLHLNGSFLDMHNAKLLTKQLQQLICLSFMMHTQDAFNVLRHLMDHFSTLKKLQIKGSLDHKPSDNWMFSHQELVVFRMRGKIGEKASTIFLRQIVHLPSLKVLDLSGCSLGKSGGDVFLKLCRGLNIETLSVAANQLDGSFMIPLFMYIASEQLKVRFLNIASNAIIEEVFEEIVRILPECKNLEGLNLTQAHIQSWESFKQNAYKMSLKVLLAGSEIEKKSKKEYITFRPSELFKSDYKISPDGAFSFEQNRTTMSQND